MTRIGARLPVLVLFLATIVLTVPAGLMLFSAFQEYDDAGYVLNSIKAFVEHGGLYRDVYSQYGPFCYALYYVAHLVGLPINHDVGFLFRLVEWSGAALFSARLVWKGTQSLACAVACLSGVFVYLWMMIGEPIHPGGTIAFLTAVLAGLGYDALRSERLSRWSVMTGAGVAALALTKINIGIFALMAAGSVWLLFHQSDRLRKFAPWLVAICLAVAPFGLMHTLLGTRWVEMFAMLFALSAIPAAGAAAREPAGKFGASHAGAALLAGISVVAVVFAIVMVRGSSLGDLLQGMVLRPLQQPGQFTAAFKWHAWTLPVAIISFGFFVFAFLFGRRTSRQRWVDLGVSILRLVAVSGLVAALLKFPWLSPSHLVMSFFGPCLWLFVWPLGNERPEKTMARSWVGFLLLGQWLHAYPVPGSQISWGTFLVVPLGVLGAWEAVGLLTSQRRSERLGQSLPADLSAEGAAKAEPRLSEDALLCQERGNPKWLRHGRMAANLGLVGLSVFLGLQIAKIGGRYFESRSLGLPGAEMLRLPDGTTSKYRIMCLNAVAHSDMLFSLPGMFSYNVWTGVPTPTLSSVTHWYEMLTVDEQAAIQQSLETHERSCVIVSDAALKFMRTVGRKPAGPLFDYIMREYVTAFTIDENQFRIRRGRKIAPFNTATLYTYQSPAGKEEPYDLLLSMYLLPTSSPIGSIEISPMDGAAGTTTLIKTGDCRVDVTPVNLKGEPVARAVARTLPVSLERASLVEVHFRRSNPLLPANLSWVVLRDEKGEESALVRFISP